MKAIYRVDVPILKLQVTARYRLRVLQGNEPSQNQHFGIKRLQLDGAIEDYQAKLNPLRLGKGYVSTVTIKSR